MNPYASHYACPKCQDLRTMTRSSRASKTDLLPCDKCGLMGADEYEAFRRDKWISQAHRPEITELDLTPEEFTVFQKMRELHPKASKLTILSWMEGQRYDPAKDPTFLQDARQRFKEWRTRA